MCFDVVGVAECRLITLCDKCGGFECSTDKLILNAGHCLLPSTCVWSMLTSCHLGKALCMPKYTKSRFGLFPFSHQHASDVVALWQTDAN